MTSDDYAMQFMMTRLTTLYPQDTSFWMDMAATHARTHARSILLNPSGPALPAPRQFLSHRSCPSVRSRRMSTRTPAATRIPQQVARAAAMMPG